MSNSVTQVPQTLVVTGFEGVTHHPVLCVTVCNRSVTLMVALRGAIVDCEYSLYTTYSSI